MLNINNNTLVNFYGKYKSNNEKPVERYNEIEKQYDSIKADWINSSENINIPSDIFHSYLQKLENEKQAELLKLDLEV